MPEVKTIHVVGNRVIPIMSEEQLALPIAERDKQLFIGKLVSATVNIISVEDGENIMFPFPKPFVPSFDKKEEDNILIFSWSNKEEGEPTVTVKGKIFKDTGAVEFTGKGFTSVTIGYTTEGVDVNDKEAFQKLILTPELEAKLTEEATAEWEKVKD